MAKIEERPQGLVFDSTDDLDVSGLLERAASMNIKRFEPRDKPGIYDDQVDTLIQVDAQTGYQNEIEILVPTPDVMKHKRYFGQSAKKRGKTARIVNGDKGVEQAEGTLLAFVLTEQVHRKPKDSVPVTYSSAPADGNTVDRTRPEKVA